MFAPIVPLLLITLAPALAADPNWGGNWDTRWPEGGALLTLKQTDDHVVGAYPLYSGTIEGTVDGRRLTGTWTEPDETGDFVFVLSEDGSSFMGRFGQDVWWTGARVTAESIDAETNISQANPADVLHAFMVISDAVENGQLEYLDNAVSLLDFGNGDLDRRDELKETALLGLVIEQLQFQLDDIRQETQSASGEATVTLTRYDDQTFDLTFVQKNGDWFIEVPPEQDLENKLSALLADTGGRVPPINHIFKMRTPRDTIEAFIDSMRVGPGGLDTAIATLDLSELSPVARDREATLIAEYLEQVLARIGEVVYQEIPNDPDSQTPYIHFTHPMGDIAIAPVETDDGVQWKFTPDTLRSVRQLFTATEDMPPAPRVLPLYRPEPAVFFKIRSVLGDLMPRLLEPLGPLEIWQWVAMVAVFLFAVIATGLISLVLMLFRRLFASGEPTSEESAFSSARFAVWGVRLLVFGLISYGGLVLLGLPDSYASIVLAVAVIAMIAGAVPIEFWIVNGIRSWLDDAGVISERGDILASLLVGVVKVAIVLGNLLLLAEALNIPYGAALAGFGIGGLAVALAARSTLENVIAGFILFADRPLAVGDFCRFGDRIGTVERIGIRSTTVRTLDRTIVSVPNADFVNMHLENYGKRDRILLSKTISLRYETTPDQLRYVLVELRKLLIGHPKVTDDPARVRFAGFSEDALDIEIFAYVQSTDWSEFLAIREDLFLRIMDIVERSGTAFAVPAQTVYFGRDRGLDAERAAAAESTVNDWRQGERLPFPNLTAAEITEIENSLAYPPEGTPPMSEQVGAGQMKAHRARRTFWSFARGGRT
ncbi:mechanosensitive ion channel family protein [Amorphus sp. 3PC139-8]|uniref:mechanosensitive ion channel family protein n=1 Tax=Amorphus sp. 3PC139-8 TaxID=2735676 RepID=UPI00345D1817